MTFLISPGSSAAGDAGSGGSAASGILVRFSPEADFRQRVDALEAVDGVVEESFGLVPGLRLVELPEGTSPDRARKELTGMPGVLFASTDEVMRLDRVPNDPLLGEQWGIPAIQAPLAWDTQTGSSDVEVAIIDTGIDLNHPDLAGNLWTNPDETASNGIDDDSNGYVDDVHGWDFVGKDPVPDDDNSHGSHTGGTVGAVGNNGIGVAGVAWDVSLVPLKICSATGRCLTSNAIAALQYAVHEGIPISNNSYGYNGSCSAAFGLALQAAGAAGHLFVASAGNDGQSIETNPKFPASCPQDNVLSVAWLESETKLAAKSNYGLTSVDLAAPGSQIRSTVPNDSYGSKSGTSMAGPHVAGVAALLKSAEPSWGWQQLKARLMDSASPVCGLPVASRGTLDAATALSGTTSPKLACSEPPVILTGPAAESGSNSATFTFGGAQGASFQCRLDSGPAEPCVSPVVYAALTDGTHRFSVTQSAEGGPESNSSTWNWAIDTTPPSAPTVSAAPVSPTAQKSASFTISGEVRASFSCSFDGGPIQTCTSPYPLSGLSDGLHSLVVFQSDRVGNRSVGTTREWTVDTQAPEAPVFTSGPAVLTNLQLTEFVFSGESETTARCRLGADGDPGSWSACSSPVSLTNLADGSYRLSVTLRDAAGNESPPADWAWTLDTQAPDPPRIESGPIDSTPASLEVSFSGEDGNSFECRLNRPGEPGAWEKCSSPFLETPVRDGSYLLSLRQVDPAGNASTPEEISWDVDTTPPLTPVVLGGPVGPTASSRAEFLITGESSTWAECMLEAADGAVEWKDCPADGTWSGLEDGAKTLRVRLRDAAGNQSEETVRQWSVDTEAPARPRLIDTPAKLTRSRSEAISIETATGSSAFCQLDNGPWSPCAGVFMPRGLGDGRHVLKVYQEDEAGNRSDPTISQWIVDRTRPVLTGASLRVTGSGRFIVDLKASDSGSGLFRVAVSFAGSAAGVRIDRVAAWRRGGRITFADLLNPTWVQVVDQAGNRSPWLKLIAPGVR
ncbi:MAG: S8 family serine peptidase [Solirubrobacterales bacterium]